MHNYGMSHDGSTITLRKFDGTLSVTPGEPVGTLLVVDVETTGLDPTRDKMIEFAATKVRYSRDGDVVEYVGSVEAREDPGVPLDDVITRVTGLTDEDLVGQRIPEMPQICGADMFDEVDLIVSHNAAFDWPHCRRRWTKQVDNIIWACSLTQIDWSDFGLPSRRQEVLARYHGFFYDAHRALIDTNALVHLLQLGPEPNGPTYLKRLLDYIKIPRYQIQAFGTPFATKDKLKARGYRWDPDQRVWWTIVTEHDMKAEDTWLTNIYRQFGLGPKHKSKPINPYHQWG